jgi:glutaredoxin
MSKTIYISRRCEHCHELLIILHKNKEKLKFRVVDVDTNSYPNTVKSVPCMVIGDKILPGRGDKKTNVKSLPGEPDKNMSSNNVNKEKLSQDQLSGGPMSNVNENEPGGYCFGGSCDLSFSSIEGDNMLNDNYEYLNSVEQKISTDQRSMNNTRKEKSAQMDSDYERMMESRKLQQPDLRPR